MSNEKREISDIGCVPFGLLLFAITILGLWIGTSADKVAHAIDNLAAAVRESPSGAGMSARNQE